VFGRATSAGLTARLVALSALLLAISALGFAVLLAAAKDLRHNDRGLQTSLEMIGTSDQALRLVVDMETGLRGYVIGGRPGFLDPYSRAQRSLPALERELVRLAASDPRLAGRTRRIVAAIQEDRRFQADQVARARRSRRAAARVVATQAGKQRVDAIRAQFADLLDVQQQIANQQRASATSAQHRLIGLVVGGLVGVPLLVVLLAVYAAKGVVTPLRRMAGAARLRQGGTPDVRVSEDGPGEVGELARAFNAMAHAVDRSREDLENHVVELEAQGEQLSDTVDALAREKERIEQFHSFVERLSAEPELDRLGPLILGCVCEAADAHAGALYVLDTAEFSHELRLAETRGVDAGSLPDCVPAGGAFPTGLLGTAGEELQLPLRSGGLLLGMATLTSADGFADPETLQRMAGAAAVALSNALSLALARRQADVNRAVLETAHDAYVGIDAELRVISWTPQAEALSGYPATEALGKPVHELLVPERWRKGYLQAHRKLLTAIEAGHTQARQFELPIRHRDGHEIWIELSAAPLTVGERLTFNGFLRDITARVARERTREAQRAVSLAIAESDAHEDVMPRVLEALARELHWPLAVHWVPEPGGGMRRGALWRDPALPASALPDAVITDPGALALRACQDGQPTWEESTLALPITCGPDGLGVLEFWDRRAAAPDPELADALVSISALIAEVLERRRAEAEAERLKNEFFALVSHELRTPLTSIIGYLDLILEEEVGEVPPQQRRFLGVIERNARRLLRLVGDLLFVAQFEAGKLSLERGTVDLEAVTREAVEAARPRAARVGVELEAQTESLPPIDGDRDRIGQVVDNLISNALKFTPSGGRVSVRALERDGRAVLEVRDNGMGIPEAEQARLFERFYRTASATERSIPGIGLGLSICQAIAEGHGGTIRVASEEGRGTTFTVELPLSGRPLAPSREVTGAR
jgi:PAS domain S-box-containing protein